MFISTYENVAIKLTILANKILLCLPIFDPNLPIFGFSRLAALFTFNLEECCSHDILSHTAYTRSNLEHNLPLRFARTLVSVEWCMFSGKVRLVRRTWGRDLQTGCWSIYFSCATIVPSPTPIDSTSMNRSRRRLVRNLTCIFYKLIAKGEVDWYSYLPGINSYILSVAL